MPESELQALWSRLGLDTNRAACERNPTYATNRRALLTLKVPPRRSLPAGKARKAVPSWSLPATMDGQVNAAQPASTENIQFHTNPLRLLAIAQQARSSNRRNRSRGSSRSREGAAAEAAQGQQQGQRQNTRHSTFRPIASPLYIWSKTRAYSITSRIGCGWAG